MNILSFSSQKQTSWSFPRLRRGTRPLIPLLALVCLLLLGIFSPGGAAPGPDLFDQVVEHRLKNGLKVLLLRESRAPIISVQVWYKVGSRNEELGKTGLSHLNEHLMFKGTEKIGPKDFTRLVQKPGGSDNAFTSRDYTAYFENGPKTELRRWLEMEADRMRGLKVSEEDFNTERNVVLEERRMRTDDDPVSFLFEEVMAAAFKAHPYQWPVIGWFNDIQSLTRDDFLQHYRRYYQPNNCTVVVVGDIEPQEALKEIEATFGALAPGPEPPKVTAKEPRQYGERRVMVHREAQLPFLLVAYHAPNWNDPDAYPLELLARILSQGRSSRLYHNLIYQQRLALQAGADYNFDTANPTLFTLHAQPLPEKTVAQLEAALEAEVKRLQTEAVEEKELQKAKNQTVAGYYMSLDSLFYRGMLLGRLETVARWTLVKEFVPKISQVTAADVQRVAKKYLVAENRNVGILSPIKTDKPKMERFTPGGQIN
ncbi:MAG: insulinase family protein [Deltaproteobacteria bacterium]|nr:insulinase family protein [Deltaproteobacteria bacterium]